VTLPAFPKPSQLPKRRQPNPQVLDDGRLVFRKPSKSWTAQRRKVWERDGRRCVQCHKPVNFDSGPDWSRAEIDHIKLRKAGGGFTDDSEENLRTLCSGPYGCHVKRHGGVFLMDEPKKKRAKPVTMTKRSMDYLRKDGYSVAIVERWFDFPERKNGFPTGKMIKQRMDAFNFADLIAVKPGIPGTLYVQTTSRDNQAARRAKILEAEAVPAIIKSGNRVQVHGWALAGARGARKLWKVSVWRGYLDDIGNVQFEPESEKELDETGEEVESLF